MLTPGLLPLQAPGELGPPHRALERCPQGARFAPWMTLTLKVSFLGSLSWAFAGQERCVLSQAVPLGLGTGVGTSVGRAGERRGGPWTVSQRGLGDAGKESLVPPPCSPSLGSALKGPVCKGGGLVHLETCSLQRGGGEAQRCRQPRLAEEDPSPLPKSLANSACRPVQGLPAARQPPPQPLCLPIPLGRDG